MAIRESRERIKGARLRIGAILLAWQLAGSLLGRRHGLGLQPVVRTLARSRSRSGGSSWSRWSRRCWPARRSWSPRSRSCWSPCIACYPTALPGAGRIAATDARDAARGVDRAGRARDQPGAMEDRPAPVGDRPGAAGIRRLPGPGACRAGCRRGCRSSSSRIGAMRRGLPREHAERLQRRRSRSGPTSPSSTCRRPPTASSSCSMTAT